MKPIDERVKASLEEQEQVVKAIQVNSDEFFGRKTGDTGTLTRRDQIMRQLAEGYDAFSSLQNNIQEGTKFYNDLTQVSREVKSFAFTVLHYIITVSLSHSHQQ